MNYCPNCGNKVDENAYICVKCGVKLKNNNSISSNDDGNFVWGLLGFAIPLVGLVLYLSMKDSNPNNAKMAGKGALISVIIGFVLAIIGIILFSVFAFKIGNDYNDNNDYFDYGEYYKFE